MFRGSAALIAIMDPSASVLRIERSKCTASGEANCSPENPPTKSTTAHLAACFKAPKHAQQFSPRNVN